MKTRVLSLLLLFVAVSLSAKNIVIENPSYEFKNTGIGNVAKIEITNEETIIYHHTTFIPNWWTKFSRTAYLEDCDTGEKYYITDIRNGEFDQEIYMPASGDSTFILVFPKLKKTVKKINYGGEDKTTIFGISLDKKKKTKKSEDIPADVSEWIGHELNKAKNQKQSESLDFNSFFNADSVRIVGYLKGYDERAGFSTGIIYAENALTREDFPTVIQFYPDGRFETTYLINHPSLQSLVINNQWVSYYIEPGQTLGVILDWEDFLNADRYRDRNYIFQKSRFVGPAAKVNMELCNFQKTVKQWPGREVYNKSQEAGPEDFQKYIRELSAEHQNILDKYFQENTVSDFTKELLRNSLKMNWKSALLDYEMDYGYNRHEKNKPELPLDFYAFLKEDPLDNPYFFTQSNFRFFMNRFEYMDPFNAQHKVYELISPKVSSREYLFEELGLSITPEDENYYSLMDTVNIVVNDPNISQEEKDKVVQRYTEAENAFDERYSKELADYQVKYMDVLPTFTQAEIVKKQWEIQDSIYRIELKLSPSLVYEIKKTRALKFYFSNYLSKEDSRTFLDYLKESITHPFLINESERLYTQNFPDVEIAAYELPAGKGTDIFKNIIDPFKGKYIFVDFWGIFCGPCVHGIKSNKGLRENYNESNDLAFIFITSDRESPLDRYNQFIEEQELKNTYRISSDEFQYLRQLFQFNGIPRYVMIDREGRVIQNNSSIHGIEKKLKELLEKEKELVQK